MEKYEKPLWHYSMQEFLDIQKQELEGSIKTALNQAVNEIKAEQQIPLKDTINIDEAIEVTGLQKSSIYSKVSRGEMPSVSRGKPLVFSRASLQQWMKLGKPSVVDMALMRRKGEL